MHEMFDYWILYSLQTAALLGLQAPVLGSLQFKRTLPPLFPTLLAQGVLPVRVERLMAEVGQAGSRQVGVPTPWRAQKATALHVGRRLLQ